MLGVMLSWYDPTVSPPFLVRIIFLIILVIPSFVKKNSEILIASIACFLTISNFGYSESYLPSDQNVYILLFCLYAILNRGHNSVSSIPKVLIILFLYVTFVDVITSESVMHISQSLGLTILLFFLNTDKAKQIEVLRLAFIVATIVLSASLIILRDQFVSIIAVGYERAGWTDPNYFGMVIGMGMILSASGLVSRNAIPPIHKPFMIGAIILGVPALALNASRGAIVSLVLGLVLLLLFSNAKLSRKFIISVLSLFFIYILYSYNIFETLNYRFLNDEATGGRTDIWEMKYSFINQRGLLSIIFGVGNLAGQYGGGTTVVGFHNDFLAFIVDYGMVGTFLFAIMLLLPLHYAYKTKKNEMGATISLMVYLITSASSLEPFTAGRFIFYVFYYYIIINSMINEREYQIQEQS